MEKLKQNKLFLYLLPIVTLAALFVSQRFLYEAYRNIALWRYALCFTASGICFVAFSFWFALAASIKAPSVKRALLFAAVAGIAATGIYIGVGAIFAALTPKVFAYGVSTAILDVLVIAALAYALGKGYKLSCAKAVSALAAAVLVLTLGFLSAFSGTAIKTAPKGGVIQDFEIKNSLPDGGNKPVKVILLGGQSNASGVSSVEYLSQKEDPALYAKYSAGYGNVSINFITENGANSSDGYFVPATLGQGCLPAYFGPEVGISDTLSSAYPNETIILIKYTWGGSNLYNQWLSPSSQGKTGDLYTAFVNFVKSNVDYLLAKNYDARIVAMCWMQGESDSADGVCDRYGLNTANLVNDLRAEFEPYTAQGGFLFADAGIADSIYWKNYTVINDAKRAHAGTSPLNVYLDTIAAGLTVTGEPEGAPDLAHYDAMSEIALGRMFGEAILDFLAAAKTVFSNPLIPRGFRPRLPWSRCRRNNRLLSLPPDGRASSP